jgi:signal transduction histidine kinase
MVPILNHPWPYLVTAAFAALILWYVWRQPHRPGARQFIRLMCVYLVWALAGTLSTVAPSIRVLYVLFLLQSVCSLVVTALELMVVLEYTGSETWIARRVLLLLFLPPLLLAIMAFISPEAFVRIDYRSGIPIFIGQPVVKWGFFAYVAIIFSISSGVLLTRLMRAPAFWAPLLLLIAGAIFPVASFALIRPQWITVPPIQVAILLTNVTMLTYFVALYSFRILQVIPVGRDMLISRMPYGLIVLDSENHLVDFNAAAQALPGLPGKLVAQRIASRALGSWWERLAPLIGQDSLSQDVVVQSSPTARTFHITSLPLLQESGWRVGQIFQVEDVTKVRLAQQQQQQAQELLATLKERERLARELHDSLGQTLAATHLQASTARLLLAQGEIDATDKCLELMADTALAAEVDVREYLLGAKTAFSPNHHFFEALRQYVVRFSQQYGLRVELSVPAQMETQALRPIIDVQLLRIIQEALSNVRKHAEAKNAQVIFTESKPLLQVLIIDDGHGFDPGAVAARQAEGFGLYSMRERAEALGGCLEVTSQPSRGTQVLVQFPIELSAEESYGVAEEIR